MPGRKTNPWLVLCLVCIAQFMVVLDATIVNVALPSIQTDLKLAENDLQWIVNAYTLIFGGFLLLGGRAGDLIGRKRVFLAGVVVFTVASLPERDRGVVDLADPRPRPAGPRRRARRAGRALDPDHDVRRGPGPHEGDGRLGRRSRRAEPRSVCCSAASSSSTSRGRGSSSSTSRSGIAAFLASVIYVPESRADAEHRIFDLPGAVTVTAGLIALVYGIVNVQKSGWTSGSTIGFGIVAVILLTAFVLIEQRQRAPLVRLGIFRVRTLRTANISMLLVASGLFAMFFFTTLYVQRVLGLLAARRPVSRSCP